MVGQEVEERQQNNGLINYILWFVFSEMNRQTKCSLCIKGVCFCVFQELWTATWDALGTNSVVDDLQYAAVTAGPHARGQPPFVTKGEKLTIIMFYL